MLCFKEVILSCTTELDQQHEKIIGKHKVIGSGLHGTVYDIGENVAMKVGSGIDYGYYTFAKTLATLGNGISVHLPELYSVTHYRLPDEMRCRDKLEYEFLVVKMEKLAELEHDFETGRFIDKAEYDHFRRLLQQERIVVDPEIQEMTAFLNLCREEAKIHYMDIHTGNVMRRPSTGELVFIDPFCSSCWPGLMYSATLSV